MKTRHGRVSPHCVEGAECGDIGGRLICVVAGGPGDECPSDLCEPGLWCGRLAEGENVPVCHPPLGRGERCIDLDGNTADCQEGAFCMTDGICLPPGEVGEPCTARNDQTCQEGLWCDGELMTCREAVGPGATCNPYSPQLGCPEGFYCYCSGAGRDTPCPDPDRADLGAPQCLALKANGESCVYPWMCASAECAYSDDGTTGTCGEAPVPFNRCDGLDD